MNIPRLSKGKGFRGPEFYGCMNTGTAPSIFHGRDNRWYVGRESPCREALRIRPVGRTYGEGACKVYIFKSRAPAIFKFKVMCGARIMENAEMRKSHAENLHFAQKGDIAAALRLGDF